MDKTDFDYVIVGAGSAGAVLANRLSADPLISVCLVEAGPEDRTPLIHTPLGLIALAKHKRYNWLHTSNPQQGLGDRKISIPRGKVLGGSSAINGMIYVRGHRADYDEWAAAGCQGWDYDSVLPYFKKSEANANTKLDPHFHNALGELSVTDLRDPNPMNNVFIEAAQQLQIRPCADFNTAEPEGVGIYQVTQKNGHRHSTATAFLTPIKDRPNLSILANTEVSNILFTGNRATGVALNDSKTKQLHSKIELILCAGAIGSPDLLLRSGVGPGEEVTAAGQQLVCDLPGVGRNLHDHVDVMVINKTRSHVPYGLSIRALPRLIKESYRWITANRGMLSSNMVEAGGFIKSSPEQLRPDIQLHIIPGRKSHRGRMIEHGHGISLHACVLNPKSRGSITRTAPAGPPTIDLGLLKDTDDLDRLRKGVRQARNILGQSPFTAYGLTEIVPGVEVQSDASLDAYIRNHARTVYHPVGTCAMGTSEQAVVDSRLRVKGLQGIRIADASVMPSIVSGNTNAPTIMIAEKAADMIVNDRRAA